MFSTSLYSKLLYSNIIYSIMLPSTLFYSILFYSILFYSTVLYSFLKRMISMRISSICGSDSFLHFIFITVCHYLIIYHLSKMYGSQCLLRVTLLPSLPFTTPYFRLIFPDFTFLSLH